MKPFYILLEATLVPPHRPTIPRPILECAGIFHNESPSDAAAVLCSEDCWKQLFAVLVSSIVCSG